MMTLSPADVLRLRKSREAQAVMTGETAPAWQLIAFLFYLVEAQDEHIRVLEEDVDIRDAVLHELTAGLWRHDQKAVRH